MKYRGWIPVDGTFVFRINKGELRIKTPDLFYIHKVSSTTAACIYKLVIYVIYKTVRRGVEAGEAEEIRS